MNAAGRRILIPEVAKILSVSPRTVRRLIASGQLGVERVFSSVGVSEEELHRFRQANFTPATVEPAPRRKAPAGDLNAIVNGAFQRTRRGSR